MRAQYLLIVFLLTVIAAAMVSAQQLVEMTDLNRDNSNAVTLLEQKQSTDTFRNSTPATAAASTNIFAR